MLSGLCKLAKASATVKIEDDHADVSDLTGDILGGQVQASGILRWAADNQAGPSYAVEAHFDGVSAAALGQLLALRWSGGPIKADGKIALSGFTAKDLAASAKGTLDFDWRTGGMAGAKPLRTLQRMEWRRGHCRWRCDAGQKPVGLGRA